MFDALQLLYKKIMPKVWENIPEIIVHVMSNINTVINNINDERFKFHGYVADIEPYFLNSKFMVAPLLIGAGVKGKIGQAFEYYFVVTTSKECF
ncbi:glycosyltransferase [Flavobacterium sp.]|uniref:glycosyltransferase n=1 Tax=Flavobacterium sp. TaxID=239 RepID=UPI003528BD1F